MFKKILIANRGEIACRVIGTARRMGIATVAVYSDADRDALHVEMADESVRIGAPPASESYLVIENIIAACKAAGADAVHPGYGFLSEQAAFPQALEAHGIAFIGPNPRAIQMMGDKIAARALAQAAGVAIVPGSDGVIDDAAAAADTASAIGYPVMIKAAAGGGGRGMRIIETAAGMAEGFARAASEAKTAFGDGRMFIEKYIAHPRHIEVQVLGDKHGNIIHLGERECSIQRRHQKIIEEAPAPCIGEVMRSTMGQQAVALARAAHYDSAGTVEFVAAPDGHFYFLEMNTRLQVEHPVTELITSIDLVEQMIRSAFGERLAITQADVSFTGWAVESRIVAEDPSRNFIPSAGRLTAFRLPPCTIGTGVALRIDSGVQEGSEVSIHYDSLLAKLITHAFSRDAAIGAQLQALDRFVIDGVANTVGFLAAVMEHKRFRSGDLSTGFLGEEFPLGFAAVEPQGEAAELFVCAAAASDHVLRERNRAITGQIRAADRGRLPGEYAILLGKTRYDVRLDAAGEGLRVGFEKTGRSCVCVCGWTPGQPVWTGTVNGEVVAFRLRPILNGFDLARRGHRVEARVLTRREAELDLLMPDKKPAAASFVLRSPMPCLVKSITVAAGQMVRSGEILCVIEAMKMETAVRAEWDATVAKILVQPGESLAVDAVIMTFRS